MKITKFRKTGIYEDVMCLKYNIYAVFNVDTDEELRYICVKMSDFNKQKLPKKTAQIKRLARLLVNEKPEQVYIVVEDMIMRAHNIDNKLYSRWIRLKPA